METDNKPSKMHPLTAAAAVALILVCLTGIAAMFGILPSFNKNQPPVVATKTAGENASTPAVAVSPPPAAEPAAPPKVVQKKPAKRPVNTAAAATSSKSDTSQRNAAPPPCYSCGVVESVRTVEHQEPTSGIGAGVGAVVGGLLGNQVGGGTGRTLATVAGAVGGGYAGNTIEKRRNTSISYEVIVRMENGERQRFMMREERWRAGDLVRVENGQLVGR
jgi:outer membrane lipoprotein SlyB